MSASICGVDPKSNFLFMIFLEFSRSISSMSHFPDGEIKEAVVDTTALFFETDESIKIKYRYILIR